MEHEYHIIDKVSGLYCCVPYKDLLEQLDLFIGKVLRERLYKQEGYYRYRTYQVHGLVEEQDVEHYDPAEDVEKYINLIVPLCETILAEKGILCVDLNTGGLFGKNEDKADIVVKKGARIQ